MGVDPGEVLLGVRGDCHGEETDPDSRVYDVVDGLAALLPEGRLAAFQIEETGTGCVGASQRFHDVIELPLTVAGAAIDGAVLAAEVAFVGYEQDGLERGAASEEAGSDEPPGEVGVLLDHIRR